MRYIIAAIVGLAILAFSSPVFAGDHTWQRPTECADEDRQVSGNRSTPCKYVMPVLEKVKYEVRMNYPECWELLIFHMPGAKPLPDDFPTSTNISMFHSRDAAPRYAKDFRLAGDRIAYSDNLLVGIDKIGYIGYGWGLGDTVSRSAFPRPRMDYPYVGITIIHGVPWPNGALYPDTTNAAELVNACLALVVQEKANREHAAEIERQEAAETARIEAERDAAAKEEEQAQREAEAQERIAEQQLAAANDRRLAIARAEVIKTQTLINEIATQEVITAILNDIVRIRLAGQEDRARITNEYLARARTASESFNLETSEIESGIQEYIDFNAALLVEIAEYRLSIQNRLDVLRASIEEQQAEIDRLEAEAQGIVAPVEEEEENIEEDQNGNGS